MTQHPPNFVRSVETETLIRLLRQQKDRELITYADMNAALKRNSIKRPKELDSARNELLKNDSLVFVTIQGEGIRLATAEEKLSLSDSHIAHTRKRTRKVVTKLATVDPATVDEKAYNAACAKLALVAAAVDRTVQRRMLAGEMKVTATGALTRAQLAEIFG